MDMRQITWWMLTFFWTHTIDIYTTVYRGCDWVLFIIKLHVVVCILTAVPDTWWVGVKALHMDRCSIILWLNWLNITYFNFVHFSPILISTSSLTATFRFKRRSTNSVRWDKEHIPVGETETNTQTNSKLWWWVCKCMVQLKVVWHEVMVIWK